MPLVKLSSNAEQFVLGLAKRIDPYVAGITLSQLPAQTNNPNVEPAILTVE